jgi:hypothetical protein
MTAKKATKRATPRKKAAQKASSRPPVQKATESADNKRDLDAAPTPVPPGINDVRDDSAAVLGHFVDVVGGEHEGRYGVFEVVEGKNAIVRTRDNDSALITCKISDLVPAEAGRR